MSEPLPRSVRRAVLLRSLAVQGSWNYQTLLGTGLAFVLAPALRHVYAGRPEELRAAVARHAELFNCHPYLATVAAGAIVRLEADGVPPETIQRFKSAIRGSLGTLGDRLVWQVWRPTCALLALVLLLLDVPWWAVLVVFLVAYNAVQAVLRPWGLEIGLRDGLQVARALREAPFQVATERTANAGALLAGMAAVLAVTQAGNSPGEWGTAALAAAAGLALGWRVRRAAAVALAAFLAAGWILARTS